MKNQESLSVCLLMSHTNLRQKVCHFAVTKYLILSQKGLIYASYGKEDQIKNCVHHLPKMRYKMLVANVFSILEPWTWF